MATDARIDEAERRRQHMEHQARRMRLGAAPATHVVRRPAKRVSEAPAAPHVAAPASSTVVARASERAAQRARITGRADAHIIAYLHAMDLQTEYVCRPTISEIISVVCAAYEVSRTDLLSQRRTAAVVKPRQIAMYLAKTLTLHTFPEIGRRFSGRDHTTALHAARKIAALRQADPALDREISGLIEILGGIPRAPGAGAGGAEV